MRLVTIASALSLLCVGGAAQGTGGLPPVPTPVENPLTPAKAMLGKALFWEEQLSSTKTVSCATCHMPEAGGADPRTFRALNPGVDEKFGTPDDVRGTLGVILHHANARYIFDPLFGLEPQVTAYKSPSVFLAAYDPDLFWNGRTGPVLYDPIGGGVVIPAGATLEAQAMLPLVSEVEMGNVAVDWPDVLTRVRTSRPLALASEIPDPLRRWLGNATYAELFARAFGTHDITPARIGMAIASYERTLIPDRAPIDAHLRGVPHALSPVEKRGFAVFRSVGCDRCHPPPLFTTSKFANVGLRPASDNFGRFDITRDPADMGAFKIPSLRNVVQRAPYFHDGRVDTLAEVIAFYVRGGDFHEHQSPLIRPFALSGRDRNALLAFLTGALTDRRALEGRPPFDHPRLYHDGPHVPTTFGHGSPGTDGRVPAIVAIDPPVVGNLEFRLAVRDGLAAAPAVLLVDLAGGHGSSPFGFPLYVGGSSALTMLALGGLIPGSSRGDGWASLLLSLPSDPGLAGVSLFLQVLVADPAARAGVAASPGTRVTLFAARP